MSENAKKGKIHWKVVGMLFLILIILPAGSWYYLTTGYNYHKVLVNELKEDFGMVPNYTATTADSKPFNFESLAGNTAVVHFMGENAVQKDYLWDRMEKLHEQFDDRNDIKFISHITNADERALPKDTAQWKVIRGTEAEFDRIARENYKMKFKEGETVLNNSQFILLDSSLIRNYYDANSMREMGRMLEHITIVMRRVAPRDIILERDKEM
ncbi:MAG: hypothetical protein ACI85O_003146 [Saprospiraceae bacterium]|jgi:hypothetical protein